MLKFRCPHCREINSQSDDRRGQIVNCSACGKRLRVPQLKTGKSAMGSQRPRTADSKPKTPSTASESSGSSDIDFSELAAMEREAIGVSRPTSSRSLSSDSSGCPQCGFSYGWDGSRCRHCRFIGSPTVQRSAAEPGLGSPPADETYGFSTIGKSSPGKSAAISVIITEYEILRELFLPPRPVHNEVNKEENLFTGKNFAASAKGMGTAMVLRPFLGPLADVIGYSVMSNGMKSDPKAGQPSEKHYSPAEWQIKCILDATTALRARGFPLKPPQLLDTLVAALKYNTTSSLIEILTDDRRTDARRGAVVALGYLGESAGPAIPLLVEELTHPELAIREQVSVSLRQIVKLRTSADAVDPLVNLTSSVTDTDVRQRVIVVLGEIGTDAHSAVPFLVSLLTDKNSDIRSKAARSLGQIGPGAEVAAVGPLLKEAFTPRESTPNTNALRAVFFITKKTKHVWQKLVAELTSQNATHQVWAEHLFLELERFVAKDAGPALVTALQTTGPEHRAVLMRALRHADHELANQNRTPEEKARHKVVWTLGCSAMLVVLLLLITLAGRGCGRP